MQKFEVRFLQEALDDLDEIVSYIAQDKPAAAWRMHDKIIQYAEDLSFFPEMGHLPRYAKIRKAGYRMLIAKPYILFYKKIDDIVFIYRVIHGARDWKRLLPEETQ
jgi:plasmid stabilization system protein ParE